MIISCGETLESAHSQRINFNLVRSSRVNQLQLRRKAVVTPMHAPLRSSIWRYRVVVIVASSICKYKKQGRGIERYARNNAIIEPKAVVLISSRNIQTMCGTHKWIISALPTDLSPTSRPTPEPPGVTWTIHAASPQPMTSFSSLRLLLVGLAFFPLLR